MTGTKQQKLIAFRHEPDFQKTTKTAFEALHVSRVFADLKLLRTQAMQTAAS